ncbi:unnamed protein product [Prorocentrum cordatum]|uniref:Uncharacterized protein n=1 Tax=Prorocentrum cordatum TaxID=2364126 RepID=A0ABN9TGK4_9DINO|nr:unnamed protein product [Polarella glacialis]
MTAMAARLLLLAPALASSIVVYQRAVVGAQHASSMDPEGRKHLTCLGRGRGNETADEFLSQCKACRLYGTDVPRIYIKEGKDGVGSRFHEVIAGMAMAAHVHMALGGVIVGPKSCHQSHGFDTFKAVSTFFNITDPNLLLTTHDPGFSQTHPKFQSFEKTLKQFGLPKSKSNIFIPSHCLACELDKRGSASSWYTPELLYALRTSFIWRSPLAFKTGVTSIAIHIRRGDVKENKSAAPTSEAGKIWSMRGVSDAWYFSLIAQISGTCAPDADIHVFSSLEGNWNSSDFDGYRERGATVHLDGDPMEAWAHFVAADVLVMAKSSFSHVPALLNDNCVVYQPYMHLPLDGWVSAQANDSAPLAAQAAEDLRHCVASRARRRRAETALQAAPGAAPRPGLQHQTA